jgi:hypothetical protein
LAAEYEGDRFAIGFDWAQNFGQQKVKGWDRNSVIKKNVKGTVVVVNSHIHNNSATGDNVLFVKGSDAQKLIEASRDDEILGIGSQKEKQNGQDIGTDSSTGATLYNDKFRFRDEYTNTYHGWMFVTDAGLWIYKKDLLLSVAAGVASGDDNPNYETIDGSYDGFISLQEFYSGKRVKSAYLMGGAGKARRPLSIPSPTVSSNRYASTSSGFTNIVYAGTSLNWKPEHAKKKFNVFPNLLMFWQQKATKAFDLATKMDSTYDARTFLGTEANIYVNYHLFKDMRLYFVGSSFFPGTYYVDVRGKPINASQVALLNRRNNSGIPMEDIPNIGTDVSYTFNIGLDYQF